MFRLPPGPTLLVISHLIVLTPTVNLQLLSIIFIEYVLTISSIRDELPCYCGPINQLAHYRQSPRWIYGTHRDARMDLCDLWNSR